MKKFLVLYDENYIKDRLSEFVSKGRLSKYTDFDFRKYKGHKASVKWIKDNIPSGYDGVCIVLDGEWLPNKYGNHRGEFIGGKKFSLIQAESHKNLYRSWKRKKDGFWKLGESKKNGDYKQLEYTFEHEIGHALCFLYEQFNSLHFFINLRLYEYWWNTRKFIERVEKPNMKVDPLWKNYGGIEKPTSIILHTDLGSYTGTHNWLFDGDTSASYNYYVDKGGQIYEWVKPELGAWHSGVVSDPTKEAGDFYGDGNPNKMSIGICFEGMGEDANDNQIKSIGHLINWLKGEYPIEKVFAHQEITSYKPLAPLRLKKTL